MIAGGRTAAAATLLAAAALLAGRAALYASPYLVLDDAFISFRYADNLAHGLGLVYNAGERVEGYTNFLWTALLAAGARLGLSLPRLAVALALGAALATLPLLLGLARAVAGWGPHAVLLAALPPLLVAAMGSQARLAMSGMETLPFVLLLTLAAWLLFLRDRPAAAGVAFAAAALTRPEGAMYALVALATIALGDESPRREQLKRALRLLLPLVAIYLPYFLWRWHYYGDLLPNTFYAKASGFSWERLQRGVDLLLEIAASWSVYPLCALALLSLPSVLRSGSPPLSRRSADASASVSAAGIRAGEDAGAPREEKRVLVVWSWLTVVVTLTYFVWVGGDFLAFFGPRFLLPALPALLLLATDGARRLADLLPAPAARTASVALAAAVLLGCAAWLSWPARLSRQPGLAFEMAGWTRLGLWLRDAVPPGTIAVGAAGVIPYVSHLPAIDMFGLTDRHIAHLPPPRVAGTVAHEKYDPEYVLGRRPDYLISTRIDAAGRPTTAGLGRVLPLVDACYSLLAVVKTRGEWPADDRWVVAPERYGPELFAAGYRMGVFRRRQGQRAGRCRQWLDGIGILENAGAAAP
ncbi:MAG TPA: hypothetical protein VGE98_11040 [Thermoanaerobaculia bacterium]